MFLFYEGSHFELIQFPHILQTSKKNKTITQPNVTIFNRFFDPNQNSKYVIPLYIILILFASLYVNLGQGGKSNFGLLKTGNIFNNLCKSMNTIKKKYYEINSKKNIEKVDGQVKQKKNLITQ